MAYTDMKKAIDLDPNNVEYQLGFDEIVNQS